MREVQPRMRGQTFLIRFADDFVIGCEREEDARRVMEVLPKRFGRYGLEIHPEKTALIDFRKPSAVAGERSGDGTFDFLGFTHYWGRSRRGYWVIKRKTAKKRVRAVGSNSGSGVARIGTNERGSNTERYVRSYGVTTSTSASAAITGRWSECMRPQGGHGTIG